MEERDDYPIIPQPDGSEETPEKKWLKIRSTQEILDLRLEKINSLQKELASLKEVVKDLLPLAQEVFDSITIDDAETHREYISLKALLDRAKTLLR